MLNISAGNWTNTGNISLASFASNTGRVTVTGGVLYDAGLMYVGEGSQNFGGGNPAVGVLTIGGTGYVQVNGVMSPGYSTWGQGAINQTGGGLYVGGEFDMGYANQTGYGFYQNSGGMATNASWMQAARGGVGLIYLTGGTNVQTGTANGLVVVKKREG